MGERFALPFLAYKGGFFCRFYATFALFWLENVTPYNTFCVWRFAALNRAIYSNFRWRFVELNMEIQGQIYSRSRNKC